MREPKNPDYWWEDLKWCEEYGLMEYEFMEASIGKVAQIKCGPYSNFTTHKRFTANMLRGLLLRRDGFTLKTIGRTMGFSIERARQITRDGLKILRVLKDKEGS